MVDNEVIETGTNTTNTTQGTEPDETGSTGNTDDSEFSTTNRTTTQGETVETPGGSVTNTSSSSSSESSSDGSELTPNEQPFVISTHTGVVEDNQGQTFSLRTFDTQPQWDAFLRTLSPSNPLRSSPVPDFPNKEVMVVATHDCPTPLEVTIAAAEDDDNNLLVKYKSLACTSTNGGSGTYHATRLGGLEDSNILGEYARGSPAVTDEPTDTELLSPPNPEQRNCRMSVDWPPNQNLFLIGVQTQADLDRHIAQMIVPFTGDIGSFQPDFETQYMIIVKSLDADFAPSLSFPAGEVNNNLVITASRPSSATFSSGNPTSIGSCTMVILDRPIDGTVSLAVDAPSFQPDAGSPSPPTPLVVDTDDESLVPPGRATIPRFSGQFAYGGSPQVDFRIIEDQATYDDFVNDVTSPAVRASLQSQQPDFVTEDFVVLIFADPTRVLGLDVPLKETNNLVTYLATVPSSQTLPFLANAGTFNSAIIAKRGGGDWEVTSDTGPRAPTSPPTNAPEVLNEPIVVISRFNGQLDVSGAGGTVGFQMLLSESSWQSFLARTLVNPAFTPDFASQMIAVATYKDPTILLTLGVPPNEVNNRITITATPNSDSPPAGGSIGTYSAVVMERLAGNVDLQFQAP